jgi:7-cyano-7-deazaguanine synthase in queuosine biosynthesis
MMALPNVNVLVSDDITDKLAANYALEPSCVKIRFVEPNITVNNDLQNIEKLIGHNLNPLVLDFYNIALAVYLADLQIRKKAKTGCRTISILISVSNPSKWNSVRKELEGTLRFLSGDTFNFHFVQSDKLPTPFRFEEKDKRVVSLLSGGLDSLSGVERLLDHGLEPVLVSHSAKNTLFKVQNALVEKLGKIAGKKLLFGQISARSKFGKKLYAKEYLEPCRSFLYLTLGMIFALELGIKKLFVFENGVLALNIPITQSRIYLNTRTTHPAFVEDYSDLVANIFGAPISIENPFLTQTKGEVVAHLNKDGFREMMRDSRTCSTESYRYKHIKTSEYTHCGICLPCLLRRIAVHYSGLWDYDARYAFDILSEYSQIPKEGTKLVFEMLDFGYRLEQCKTDDDVINEFPQFLAENFDPAPLIAMYRRQMSQTKEFLRQRAHSSFKQNLPWL